MNKKNKKMKSNNISLNESSKKEWNVEEVEPNENGKLQRIENGDFNMANKDGEEPDIKPTKRKKRGIIYLSSLPKYMNVTTVREIFSEYGTVKRIFLQPAVVDATAKVSKSKRRFTRSFSEGWIEFESKSKAKRIATHLNTQPITDKKHSKFSGMLWNMKYIPRFKWTHLSERLAYENAVHRQKMTAEISQAKKEAAFFQNNLDHSENIKKKNKTPVNET